jgi:hypothetical protein
VLPAFVYTIRKSTSSVYRFWPPKCGSTVAETDEYTTSGVGEFAGASSR